jgi:hypothetical protein
MDEARDGAVSSMVHGCATRASRLISSLVTLITKKWKKLFIVIRMFRHLQEIPVQLLKTSSDTFFCAQSSPNIAHLGHADTVLWNIPFWHVL